MSERDAGIGTRASTIRDAKQRRGTAAAAAVLWLTAMSAVAVTMRDVPTRSLTASPDSRASTVEPRVPVPLANADSAAGATLFVGYNCIDCHGVDGSGAMGPSLADNRWRFGGSAEEVYRSIADGRPEGMPRWGPKIPPAQIRQLAAYVRSLGAGRDVTTEDFRGQTVTTVGH
jgi:mono/diheme cytochrome c family protein